jgi:hypothetical protein
MNRWLPYELARNDHTRIGFWPLLKNDRDYSGRGNHATPQNGCSPTRVSGMNGYRLSIDDNAYLSLGNSTDLAFDNNAPWTVSLWYFRENQSGSHALLSFFGPTLNGSWAGWRVWVDSSHLNVGFTATSNFANNATSEGFAALTGGSLASTDLFRWYHIAVTYNGSGSASGFRLYVNGRRRAITWNRTTVLNSWVPPTLSQAAGYIGHGPESGDVAAQGAVRIVQAWKRELNGREVAQRFAVESSVDTFGMTEAEKDQPLYLFIHGHASESASPPLFLQGGGPSKGLPLFTKATQSLDTEPGVPLFINGQGIEDASIPLYLPSAASVTDSLTLYIAPPIDQDGSLNLFLQAPESSSGDSFIPLSVLGSSGAEAHVVSIPLFLEVGASGSDWSSELNLFTEGFDRGPLATNMNLFIHGATIKETEVLPLYLWNSQSGDAVAMPLVMWAGPTGDPGSLPLTGAMNLYIDRPTDAILPLFIGGGLPEVSSLPFYVEGSQGIPIWEPSGTTVPVATTMLEQGFMSPYLITQGIGEGSGSSSGDVPVPILPPGLNLVLANVVGEETYSVTFYTHGY